MVAQLHHFHTNYFGNIQKKGGKKGIYKENDKERFEKIYTNKKECYCKKFLKKITIENKFEKEGKTHNGKLKY